MSDREIFIIEDTETKLIDGYHGTIHRSDKLDAQVKRLQARVRDKLDGITFDDERDEGITPSTPPA